MPKASIIIPHYNQTQFLKIVLPSIANQTFQDYEVIIIDDCTPDRSAVEYIKTFIKDYRNMRLVENRKNMRFIKTVNKGIRLSNGEYICLLNCDTEVEKNFIERNIEILDSDASIVGLSGIILDKYGKNWWSGGRFANGYQANLTDDFEGIRSVDFVAGTAAFYRKRVFEQVGLFDESYRMYHEDVEFGLRIRAETDYKLCAFSDKLVVHYHVNSIPGIEIGYLLNRNHIWMLRKYHPQLLSSVVRDHLVYWRKLLANDLRRRNLRMFFGNLIRIRGVLAGLLKMPKGRARLTDE